MADAGKVGVEAAVESDLQLNSGGFHGGERAVDLFEAVGDGLLAEDVLAGFGGRDDQIGVGIGGRADQHRFDRGSGEYPCTDAATFGNAAMGGQRLRGLAIDVGDRHDLRLRQPEGQRFSMYAADAASAYDSEMKLLLAQCALAENGSNRVGC